MLYLFSWFMDGAVAFEEASRNDCAGVHSIARRVQDCNGAQAAYAEAIFRSKGIMLRRILELRESC